MRRLPLLVIAFALAGCGSASEGTGVPASSGQEGVSPPALESELRPPEIVLRSSGGEQRAVGGSFCVSGRGGGVCGDSPAVHPDAITVAQPGDEATFVFREAEIVRPEGCHAENEQGCIGYVYVKPLGCEDREVTRVPLALGPETRWTIDLEPGAYELDVFGYFESNDGATGDVSGALGLLVGGGPKTYDYAGVVGIKRAMQICPFAD